MEKIEYTEYQEAIKSDDDQDIVIITQLPKEEIYPAHVIIKSGRRWLRYSLDEWSAINNAVVNALSEAGWEKG